jgi:hypothetical protein
VPLLVDAVVATTGCARLGITESAGAITLLRMAAAAAEAVELVSTTAKDDDDDDDATVVVAPPLPRSVDASGVDNDMIATNAFELL